MFKSVEHAFVAAKSRNRDDWEAVMNMDTPAEAKKFGRTIKLRPDWNEKKAGIMLTLIGIKFKDDELKRKLLDTGNDELVEANQWGDTYWGVDKSTGKGENVMGKILMQTRSKLK